MTEALRIYGDEERDDIVDPENNINAHGERIVPGDIERSLIVVDGGVKRSAVGDDGSMVARDAVSDIGVHVDEREFLYSLPAWDIFSVIERAHIFGFYCELINPETKKLYRLPIHGVIDFYLKNHEISDEEADFLRSYCRRRMVELGVSNVRVASALQNIFSSGAEGGGQMRASDLSLAARRLCVDIENASDDYSTQLLNTSTGQIERIPIFSAINVLFASRQISKLEAGYLWNRCVFVMRRNHMKEEAIILAQEGASSFDGPYSFVDEDIAGIDVSSTSAKGYIASTLYGIDRFQKGEIVDDVDVVRTVDLSADVSSSTDAFKAAEQPPTPSSPTPEPDKEDVPRKDGVFPKIAAIMLVLGAVGGAVYTVLKEIGGLDAGPVPPLLQKRDSGVDAGLDAQVLDWAVDAGISDVKIIGGKSLDAGVLDTGIRDALILVVDGGVLLSPPTIERVEKASKTIELPLVEKVGYRTASDRINKSADRWSDDGWKVFIIEEGDKLTVYVEKDTGRYKMVGTSLSEGQRKLTFEICSKEECKVD